MAYERQYHTNGDVLEARQLNHMETGIKENSDSVSKLSEEKANRIVETASGETIVVTDSDEKKPLGLAIDGKSEQNQYSGTNLFDESLIEPGTINPETGEDTSDANFYRSGYLPIVNGSYVFSCKGQLSQYFRLFWYDANKNYLSQSEVNLNSVVESPSGVAYYRARWKKEDGITEIMINSGETALPYEPYCGGIPSPNPSYPQEIRNIGVYDEASGKYAVEVKCTGKNLSKEVVGSANLAQYGVALYIKADLKPSTKYTLSFEGTVGNKVYVNENLFKEVVYINPIVAGVNTITVITKDTLDKGSISMADSNGWIIFKNMSGNTVPHNFTNIMLRYAEITDDTYEPWKEPTTATVYLDEPLRKGDKAYWNGGSKLRIDRYRAVEVFDGSGDEGWNSIETNTSGKYRVYSDFIRGKVQNISISKIGNHLCNRYINVSANSAGTFGCNAGLATDDVGRIFIYDENFNTSDISLWKTHLAENPITLEYELATPTTEEIDLSLDGLSMFYPTTVISNDCNANMEVEYIADTKAYVDKKITEVITAML